MKLTDLLVTQNDLRNWQSLPEMADFVRSGGRWDQVARVQYASDRVVKVSPAIQITMFEDDALYVHDGHHRCCSTWLGGRTELYPDEYQVSAWTYEQYLEINVPNKWYTPFDPRIHLRVADVAAFKVEAAERFQANPIACVKWIRENAWRFRCAKNLNTVPELAECLGRRLDKAERILQVAS